MGSFTKQQVAVNREQRLKQWRPFVSVCERRVKEPQRWERPRQPAFSHWLEGTAFLRRFFIVRKTVRKKKKKNGCQKAELLRVLTRTKNAGRGLFTEQFANKERNRWEVCLKRRYSIRTQQRGIIQRSFVLSLCGGGALKTTIVHNIPAVFDSNNRLFFRHLKSNSENWE